MQAHVIHLYGDSIGKGVVFDETRKRYCITPGRCVLKLQEALGYPIINHSRMGAIASEGLADFLESKPEPGALVIIEFGGNDCDMPWKEVSQAPHNAYSGKVSREAFEQTLRNFVDTVRSRDMIPLLVTPSPLEASRYFDWVTQGLSKESVLEFLGDVQHIYRWQERYSVAVRNVAIEKQCTLFDMRDAFLNHHSFQQLLCIDGIHPNAAGHALIAQAVLDTRESLVHQLFH